MGRTLTQLFLGELANLEKDPESRRAAMKALKSYVRDLDSKTIPAFVAHLSEIKDPGSASRECTISLFEVLVRSQGRGILPHIDKIMDTIIRTISSSSGSFALHQSCSKVVSAIARYGIDPLMPEDEKTRIICSLCKPLSNVLLGSQESVASGAALCLRALVESDNWRFAYDDVVNEVCLKVAGALEETQTQTTSHMGLVVALLQHNSFVLDPYSRSLIRSGIQILTADAKEKNSQKRLSAIQMINFLMKCVDPRGLSSEISNIIDVMEKRQDDQLPYVKTAAFEALQTAKILAGDKGSWQELCSSPFVGSNSVRIARRNTPQIGRGGSEDAGVNGTEFSSVEFSISADNDPALGSPQSRGESSRNVQCGRHATRRLWDNVISSFDVPEENGCCCEAVSSSESSTIHLVEPRNGELSETFREHSETLQGSAHPSPRNIVVRPSTPQRSGHLDHTKMCSTPRNLSSALQKSSSASIGDPGRQNPRTFMSPASVEVEWNPRRLQNKASNSCNLYNVTEARADGSIRRTNSQKIVPDAEHMTNGTELPSSAAICSSECACMTMRRGDCTDMHKAQLVREERGRYGKTGLSFLCCLFMVFIAVILLAVRSGNDVASSSIVPT